MPTTAPTAAPPHAPCRVAIYVLIDVYLAVTVLGDHGGVVGPDRARGVQVLHDVVIGPRHLLVGIGADEQEYSVSLAMSFPLFLAVSWDTAVLAASAAPSWSSTRC